MSGSIKNFFKTTVVYGFVGSLRSFVELLLLPIYARFLLPAEFGVLDIIIVWLAIAALIVVLELNNGVFRFYLEEKSHRFHRRLVSTAMLYNVAVASLIFLGTLFFSEGISEIGTALVGNHSRDELLP